MKKLLAVLITFFALVLSVNAEDYLKYNAKDCTLNFDAGEWDVISRNDASASFRAEMENNDVYIYASGFLHRNPLEFDLTIREAGKVPNLHTLSGEDLQKFIDKASNNVEIIDPYIKTRVSNVTLFETNSYKFLVADYYEKEQNYKSFSTVINGNTYTFRFHRTGDINSNDYERMYKVIRNLEFTLDSHYENLHEFKDSVIFWIVFIAAIILSAICIVYTNTKKDTPKKKHEANLKPIVKDEPVKEEKEDLKEEPEEKVEEKVEEKEVEEVKTEEKKPEHEEKEEHKPIKQKNEKVEHVAKPTADFQKKQFFKCNTCGALVPEESERCPQCGASFAEPPKIEDEEEPKEFFKCDKCGAIVDSSQKKCPGCGESFEDEQETETSIDKKYEALTKLKELLDKKIITKEEFENEKKKILK